MVKEDEINRNRCKSIRKSENKMIKILTKLKSQNLSKFIFKNLF